MPTYNRQDTIKKAIDSVLSQTYSDFEFIIVDDGSVDKTDSIINEYSDKRIKYIKLKENKGACYARNYGVLNASGEYIAFHDSDDIMHSDKLEKQLKFLNESKADICFCKYNFIKNGVTQVRPYDTEISKFSKMNIHDYIVLCGNIISTQCIFGKRECFSDILFDESLPRLQDYDVVIKLSQKYNFAFLNDVLVDVIVQSDSISMNSDKLKKAVEIITYGNRYNLDKRLKNGLDYRLNYIYANNVWKTNPVLARSYFKKCLKIKFDFKILIKYFLCIIRK